MQVLQIGPKIPIGRGKYEWILQLGPKSQMVEENMSVGIVIKPQNSSC